MKELLKRLGWSQKYFANYIGVSVNTINNWCKGNPNPAAMKLLEKIARDLDV